MTISTFSSHDQTHDSTIFDGVDERQRAEALELAVSESRAHGFQYICTLNSDYVPRNEFSTGFQIEDYIRLRLTDADVTGCLMGGYRIAKWRYSGVWSWHCETRSGMVIKTESEHRAAFSAAERVRKVYFAPDAPSKNANIECRMARRPVTPLGVRP